MIREIQIKQMEIRLDEACKKYGLESPQAIEIAELIEILKQL